MQDNPTFSIVIPTYNNVELFSRAVRSMLDQGFGDWEIIVTDDSTTGGIEDYCRSLADPRIRYHRREPRKGGAVANWNNGLSMATGHNIIVLHHDEELSTTDYLSRLADALNVHDLVVSDIRVCHAGEPPRRGRINGLPKRLMLRFPSTLLNTNAIGPCACLAFRHEIMQLFDPALTWVVDTEWYYRLLKSAHTAIYRPDLVILSNSGHADQITLNIDIAEKNRVDTIHLRSKYRRNPAVRTAIAMKRITSRLRKLLRK